MFDCGINKTMHELSNQIMMQEENTIVRVVQEAGYSINKEQLTKALTDAHSFYNQGYDEGFNDGYSKAFMDIIANLRVMYIAFGGSEAAKNLDKDDQDENS